MTGEPSGVIESDYLSGEVAAEAWRDQGVATGRLEMDDLRQTGDWTQTSGHNRYRPCCSPEAQTGLAEITMRTVTIENDGGTWVGTLLGVSGTERANMHHEDSWARRVDRDWGVRRALGPSVHR